MGLTSTANKVSKLTDLAEKLYKRVEAIREQIQEVRDTVGETNERVADLEDELDEQRAIIEALAAESGVDVDEVLADAGDNDLDDADT
ncbi:DUF5798 family protein [Halarchaeum sp. P4]|uniref:DUF5798 family protein n=1 Tax=Halarchaeum sp. P4 TaxID=3421639 RepID=UPI003EBE9ED9